MNKKHRILFLTQSFIRYKEDVSSAYLFVLARRLSKLGQQVVVLAPHQEGLKKYEVIDGLEIYRFKYMWDEYEKLAYSGNMQEMVRKNVFNKILFCFFLFSFLFKGLGLVKRLNINLIHAHWWIPSGLIGAVLSFLCQKPLVITSHGTDLTIIENSKAFLLVARKVFQKSNYVTVVSNFLKNKLISKTGLAEEKVGVIPMPVNSEKIKFLDKKEKNKKKIILSVARFTKQKRLDVLLEALPRLRDGKLDFEAWLVGDGPEKDNLVSLTRKLNLSSQVRFFDLVPQSSLNEFYNICDICVLVSVDEGFGLVLAEALLCKKPVIGADSGGIVDIIQNGITGILIPPDDASTLADAICKLLTNEELARRLADSGHDFVCNNLTPEIIAEKFATIYRRILND